jgi:hypothetical protein
VGGLTL